MANYTFVADSTFQPLSMQEMMVPFTAYKDAFEKEEATYDALNEKADTFKYLSETLPDGSKARKIYEGYANELNKQASDLAKNGLSMNNRRALMSLKKRYSGEIGRLVRADEALKEERKLRRSLNAQDPSRLYAENNLSIDNFLDEESPNLYSISGNELYAKGAAAGKAASMRQTKYGDMGSLINNLYRDVAQTVGYGADAMAEFRNRVESIPELAESIDDIMNATGASQNLTGVDRGRARQNIINGILDGAVYQEQHQPVRDANVLDAAQKLNMQMEGYSYDNKTGKITYDPNNDPQLAKARAIAAAKSTSSNKNTSNNGTTHASQLTHPVRITWNGNPDMIEENDYDEEPLDNEDATSGKISHKGKITDYNTLPSFAQNIVDKYINGDDYTNYDIYYRPYSTGTLWNDDAVVEIEPRKTGVTNDATSSPLDFNIH